MKLVRFDGGKTGLMVQFASGPLVIDVIGSMGVLSPGDSIFWRRQPKSKPRVTQIT